MQKSPEQPALSMAAVRPAALKQIAFNTDPIAKKALFNRTGLFYVPIAVQCT
jgi:hypothetical protein